MHTKKEINIKNSDVSKGLECYVDTDFVGGWSWEVGDYADNVISMNVMVILYANYLLYWSSSLQTVIALSTYAHEEAIKRLGR